MMTNLQTHYARSGATAIAAVLAVSSIQLSAQEAPTAQSAPTTTTTPVPETTTTADPLAPAPTATDTTTNATPKTKTTVKHTASVKKTAAAARTRTVTRAPAKQPTAPIRAARVVPVVQTPTAAAPKPAAEPTPSAAQTKADNLDTAMEIGGGALALLVVGGGTALAIRRRRRKREEEELAWADAAYEPEPAPAELELTAEPRRDFDKQPAVYAPAASAFGWGNAQPAAKASDDGSDRRAGETWVERAYRGPTPANPSVSLRARLKRAAFFDKREREVAAGTSVAVESDAGLPDNPTGALESELA
jgi:hypothetical protein